MQNNIFINKCLQSIATETSLQSIFSLHSKINRKIKIENQLPENYQIDIYRAQGGRIRIEKYFQEQTITTVLNGLVGIEKTEVLAEKTPVLVKTISLDKTQVMEIKREVKLYPRNFLAHINEYKYNFHGLQSVNGISFYILDFLDEGVTYYFDPITFYCLSKIDRTNNSKTYYSDYKNLNNIFTPFEEKTIYGENQTQIDTIQSLEYNLQLSDDLFVV